LLGLALDISLLKHSEENQKFELFIYAQFYTQSQIHDIHDTPVLASSG